MQFNIDLVDPRIDVNVARVAFEAFSCHIERFYPNGRQWFYETVLPQYEEYRRCIWIARVGLEPIALAISKSDLGRLERAKICTLFVEPGSRRRGVGTVLLSKVVQWHDWRRFRCLIIRCPTEVRDALEPLLMREGFVVDPGAGVIPISLAPEVSFSRVNPLTRTNLRRNSESGLSIGFGRASILSTVSPDSM
jgi:GNAT superfamily N-acetyltransferase